MKNLEQTVERSFLGKVKNYAGRIKNSAVGKIAVYSLAGVLSGGLGYGCGGDKTIALQKDTLDTYETEIPKNDSKQDGLFCPDKTFDGTDDNKNLSQVKIVSLYERVGDGKLINRSVADTINLFKETKTDFIFRGWWLWSPCYNNCQEVPLVVESTYPYGCKDQGYSYEHLEDAISEIKKEMPYVIFCGAIPAQRINYVEFNPITGHNYEYSEIEAMALDPADFGITTVSKEELQNYFQEHGTGGAGYFPDITNSQYQELLLSWAKRQVDAGADVIWIDALFGQARAFIGHTKDPNHPAVKKSFDAVLYIIDEVKKYGASVGTWSVQSEIFPVELYPSSHLDFVTKTLSVKEIRKGKFDDEGWDAALKDAGREEIPLFAFIDWAGDNTPMAVFSQELDTVQQIDFLIKADDYFIKKGITFIYPIHGGYMGPSAIKLSFSDHPSGGTKVYDSLAPEFQTYETIKKLALKKAGE